MVTGYEFNIVLPWDKNRLRDDSRLRWPISFLRDRNIPPFVYVKPPEKTAERVCFLTEQLCRKKRRWVVCIGDNIMYTNKLLYYVAASFVLTTGLSAEITTPKKLMDFAFNFGSDLQFGCVLHPFQVCHLLVIPYFDPIYPGYQKARPKITALLLERKIHNKPCMIEIYIPRILPTSLESVEECTPTLIDVVGDSAESLFGDSSSKAVVIKAEDL